MTNTIRVNSGQINGFISWEAEEQKKPVYDNERKNWVLKVFNYGSGKKDLFSARRFVFKIFDKNLVEKVKAIINYQRVYDVQVECVFEYRLSSVCAYKFGTKYWFESKVLTEIRTTIEWGKINNE